MYILSLQNLQSTPTPTPNNQELLQDPPGAADSGGGGGGDWYKLHPQSSNLEGKGGATPHPPVIEKFV